MQFHSALCLYLTDGAQQRSFGWLWPHWMAAGVEQWWVLCIWQEKAALQAAAVFLSFPHSHRSYTEKRHCKFSENLHSMLLHWSHTVSVQKKNIHLLKENAMSYRYNCKVNDLNHQELFHFLLKIRFCSFPFIFCDMILWLAMKAAGQESFCVEFTCSCCACVGFLRAFKHEFKHVLG